MTKIIDHIEVHAPNLHLFVQLYKEMDTEPHIFSYTEKWDGFLKEDHWPGFLSYESFASDFFLKNSHH